MLFRFMKTHIGSSPATYSVCVTRTLARKMVLYSSLDNKEHLSPSEEPRNKFAWWHSAAVFEMPSAGKLYSAQTNL